MKKMDSMFIGLMLFSMYFGAGNLIFPPLLGAQAGTSFWLAIAGFVLTGVGLPLIVLIAISRVKGGIDTIGNRVHPLFSTLFMVVVYLSIGPFLAIPRNATVAFEMSVMPFVPASFNSTLALFLYTAVFFSLALFVSLNPAKMEKYMGRWITPVLLTAMVVLCAAGLWSLDAPMQSPAEAYKSGAFFKGFLEGYNTMDALASLAFGIVILTAVKQRGALEGKQLTSYTIKAALVAGLLLTLVYVFLGLMGSKMAAQADFASGTALLSSAATLLFGKSGTLLLGLIFTLACFTTVAGLTTACGQYFSKLVPKLSYKMVVLAVTLTGFMLANLGLSQILKVSVPFLVTAYPLTIVLITLTFFNKYFRNTKKVYGTAMLFTGVFAALSGLSVFGLSLGPVQGLREALPFASVGMEWVVPALAGTVLGMLLSLGDQAEPASEQTTAKAS